MMKLLLFDVDLTLINTAGSGRRAMTFAFENLFNTRDGLDNVNFAGRTDRAIFKDALKLHEMEWDKTKEEQFKNLYFGLLESEMKKPNQKKHIEPGIVELLNMLHTNGEITLGLLTGNWYQGARIKLLFFNLFHYFRFGAYADDSEFRNDLPQYAVQRCLEITGQKIHPENIIIIGDTPLDVACAKVFGAKSIAVATGFFSYEELEKAQPDFLFHDLSNVDEFLSIVTEQ